MTKLEEGRHAHRAPVCVASLKNEPQRLRDDRVSQQQEVEVDPAYEVGGEASKVFAQQDGCSRKVTSQCQFSHRTAESHISGQGTLNPCQSIVRNGEEELRKKAKIVVEENVKLVDHGFSLNASSHEECLQSTIVESKREHLIKIEQRCRMEFTLVHHELCGCMIYKKSCEQFHKRFRDCKNRYYSPGGKAGLIGTFDPLVLLEENLLMELVSFSVLPVNKHREKDGWRLYSTKKKLEQVLKDLQCQNARLEAEIEQVKCMLGSKPHVPQACDIMDWKPDISAILPIDCIALVISFTSPLDACRLSLVCRAFHAAARMDAVWERFVPSDYFDNCKERSMPSDVLRIALANSFLSAKEKFYFLCRNYLLLDNDTGFLSLDRRTGKKCYLTCDSKLLRLQQRIFVGRMDGIEGIILSPKTAYVAYFVFKVDEVSFGLEKTPLEMFVDYEGCGGEGARVLLLEPPEDMDEMPRERPDDWKEIVMGEFFTDCRDDGATVRYCLRRPADARVYLHGLHIMGIEFRPKVVHIS